MQKTIIGKFPLEIPSSQPRLGHGQNNLSLVESHYVILPPETMPPAADPLIISKIYQDQSEEICAPSEDSPCFLPTVRMISSGSLTTISHPLSALPLQFQADPEDNDYTREAKEQAAWEAAALMEAGRSGVGISRVFGHGCSAPIGETTPHSDRRIPRPRGKSSSPRPTSTHQRRPGDVAAAIFARTTDGFGVIFPGSTQAFDAQASIKTAGLVDPAVPLATLGGGKHPNSGSSNLSVPREF